MIRSNTRSSLSSASPDARFAPLSPFASRKEADDRNWPFDIRMAATGRRLTFSVV
jgi:hypothetical protein